MYNIKDVLNMQVAPALGCTEPVAVALCGAAASTLFSDKNIDSIELTIDSNIYKNGIAVSIPGTGGESGLEFASALGVFAGEAELKLETLRNISQKDIDRAREFVNNGKVKLKIKYDNKGIFVKTVLKKGDHKSESIIKDVHDNIVSISFNGKRQDDHPLISGTAETKNSLHKLEKWLIKQSLSDLIAMLDQLDDEDFDFIKQGVEFNLRLADDGLKYGPGLGIGLAFKHLVSENLLKEDMVLAARILTSAASDSRMSGSKLVAMSSAGSGNHGLTAILPIWAVKDFIKYNDEKDIFRAITLSHLVTAYVKAFTGRLSAVCGCSVAAGAGATAGITYLLGGNLRHIAGAIKILISDLAGVICDGAKTSCSLKLSTASGTAVQSALFALHGVNVKATDGIIDSTPEQTMKNVGELSTKGMIETDRTILQIMLRKQFEIS